MNNINMCRGVDDYPIAYGPGNVPIWSHSAFLNGFVPAPWFSVFCQKTIKPRVRVKMGRA